MRELGQTEGESVGCFFVMRRDAPSPAAPGTLAPPVPVLTLHRLTRRIAIATAAQLASASAAAGYLDGYEVAALESECDCQGRAELELDTVVVGNLRPIVGSASN